MDYTPRPERWEIAAEGMSTEMLLHNMQEAILMMKDCMSHGQTPEAAEYYYQEALFFADKWGKQAGAEMMAEGKG